MSHEDRTVHAVTEDGREIVRYDRSGKWYWESDRHREHISLHDAVALATQGGSIRYVGLQGGSRFTALCAQTPAEEIRPGP